MSTPDQPNDPGQQPAQPEQPAAPQYQPPAAPQQSQYAAPQAPQQPQYAPPQAPQYAAPAALPAPGPGEPFDGTTNLEDLSRPYYGISFGNAIKRFFKNYANFTGRASRSEYWWVYLFTFLVMVVPGIIYTIGLMMTMVATTSYSSIDAYGNPVYRSDGISAAGGIGLALLFIGGLLLFVIGIALLVPTLSITWRRLHDANLAGPMFFLSFIPYVGSLVLIVLTILPPKPEGRRFLSSK